MDDRQGWRKSPGRQRPPAPPGVTLIVNPIVARNTAWCNTLPAHLNTLAPHRSVWVRFFYAPTGAEEDQG
jgi:hypothetical protein